MFIGEYYHAVDEKGRIAVPKKYHKDFAKGAVVTRGIDQCLFLFPKKEWELLAAKLAGLPLSQANPRAFSRLMLAGAMDMDLDGQGRIIVPEYLREFAKLNKQVVVAGLYSRLEIWDEQSWANYKHQSESNAVDIAEQLNSLGV